MIKTHIEALRDTNDLLRLALDRSEEERAKLRKALEHLIEFVDECAMNKVVPDLNDGDWPVGEARAALGGGK